MIATPSDIDLKKPYPQLKYWLAFPFTTPVAREAVEYYDGKEHDGVVRDRFRMHPVGTGAFKLAEFQSQHFIRLVRNDHYISLKFPTGGWTPDREQILRPYAGHALPIVDEIQYNIIREIIPSWVLFKQGWLDATTLTKDTFSSAIDANHQLYPEYQKRGMKTVKNVELMTW
ncbi:MAG: ABC transporter substrate-binding protein [Chthoniobacteraceae bacterium]